MMSLAVPPASHRADPAVPAFDDAGPVAVIDAACGLCARGARWIARNDWRGEFRIVPIQSSIGQALARHYGVDHSAPETWLVIADGMAWTGFDAMLWCADRFGGPWRMLALGWLVPRRVRAGLYGWVARRRYRFFGRTDLCALPDHRVQARLVREPCKTDAERA